MACTRSAQSWVNGHGHYVEQGGSGQCAYCHGSDYRGSYLSQVTAARSFTTDDGGHKTYNPGDKVTCYDCHNGPGGDRASRTSTRNPHVACRRMWGFFLVREPDAAACGLASRPRIALYPSEEPTLRKTCCDRRRDTASRLVRGPAQGGSIDGCEIEAEICRASP